ncbi:MAG: CsbD family protein [Bryobacteraceae bacterium]
MNVDRLQGNWKQLMGEARKQWGKLTDNDWEQVAGNRDKLMGLVQERYGIAKDAAQKQVDDWYSSQKLANEEHAKSHGV